VLSLYRTIVRSTARIADSTARAETRRFVRHEFDRHRHVADLVCPCRLVVCIPPSWSLVTLLITRLGPCTLPAVGRQGRVGEDGAVYMRAVAQTAKKKKKTTRNKVKRDGPLDHGVIYVLHLLPPQPRVLSPDLALTLFVLRIRAADDVPVAVMSLSRLSSHDLHSPSVSLVQSTTRDAAGSPATTHLAMLAALSDRAAHLDSARLLERPREKRQRRCRCLC